MADESMVLEIAASDMGTLTVGQVVCTNCIEGYCPARTPAAFAGEGFMLCGAKKLSQPVLEAYQTRLDVKLHSERPC